MLSRRAWELCNIVLPSTFLVAQETALRQRLITTQLREAGRIAFNIFSDIHRDISFDESIVWEHSVRGPLEKQLRGLHFASIQSTEENSRQAIAIQYWADGVKLMFTAETIERELFLSSEQHFRCVALVLLESSIRQSVSAGEAVLFRSLHTSFRKRRDQIVVDAIDLSENHRRNQIKLRHRYQLLNIVEGVECAFRSTAQREFFLSRLIGLDKFESTLRGAIDADRGKWLQQKSSEMMLAGWANISHAEETQRRRLLSDAYVHRSDMLHTFFHIQSLVTYKNIFVERFALEQRGLMTHRLYQGKLQRLEWAERRGRQLLQDFSAQQVVAPLIQKFAAEHHALFGSFLFNDSSFCRSIVGLLERAESLQRAVIGDQYVKLIADSTVSLALTTKTEIFKSDFSGASGNANARWMLWQDYVRGYLQIRDESVNFFKLKRAEASVSLLLVKRPVVGSKSMPPAKSLQRKVRDGLAKAPGVMLSLEAPPGASQLMDCSHALRPLSNTPLSAEKSVHRPYPSLAKDLLQPLLFLMRCKRQELSTAREEDLALLKQAMTEERSTLASAEGYKSASDVIRKAAQGSHNGRESLNSIIRPQPQNPSVTEAAKALSDDDDFFDPESTQGHRTLRLLRLKRELHEQHNDDLKQQSNVDSGATKMVTETMTPPLKCNTENISDQNRRRSVSVEPRRFIPRGGASLAAAAGSIAVTRFSHRKALSQTQLIANRASLVRNETLQRWGINREFAVGIASIRLLNEYCLDMRAFVSSWEKRFQRNLTIFRRRRRLLAAATSGA